MTPVTPFSPNRVAAASRDTLAPLGATLAEKALWQSSDHRANPTPCQVSPPQAAAAAGLERSASSARLRKHQVIPVSAQEQGNRWKTC